MKIDEEETQCGVWQIITVVCVTYVQKELLDLNFNEAVINKLPNFYEITLNFTYTQES